jgi:hypothetical protein
MTRERGGHGCGSLLGLSDMNTAQQHQAEQQGFDRKLQMGTAQGHGTTPWNRKSCSLRRGDDITVNAWLPMAVGGRSEGQAGVKKSAACWK